MTRSKQRTDQRSSNALDKCFVQQVERENSLPNSTRPTTTPFEQQGMRSKEKSSSHRERASSNTATKGLKMTCTCTCIFILYHFMINQSVNQLTLFIHDYGKSYKLMGLCD